MKLLAHSARRPTTILAALWLLVAGCSTPVYAPQFLPSNAVPSVSSSPLRVHLDSGDLLVLSSWRSGDSTLTGFGYRYSPQRDLLPGNQFEVPLESVALLEIEVQEGKRPTAAVGMAIWSVLWGITTISCLADPKSCFGSCPTFYVESDDGPVLAAEGFSSSILRVLEEEDLDALYGASSTGGDFTVLMRNEAWETHAVRSLKLVASRREPGRRVMNDGAGRFHSVGPIRSAVSCRGPEEDCASEVAEPDGVERYSLADSTNLAARETIELEFEGGRGAQGIILAARHSLMSTYLFYESMGFLGSRAADVWADLERGGAEAARQSLQMQDRIGRIDVQVLHGDEWVLVGSHDEAGPLATQFVVVPIERDGVDGEPIRVRLVAAKGAWRIDWVAVADIAEAPPTIELLPQTVSRDGRVDDVALDLLLSPDRHLVTYPGDDYHVGYVLPESGTGWDLFLEATGYYYEWMRSQWVQDEDLFMAALVRSNPDAALRLMAPAFKRAEPRMEAEFWSSRFGR